MSFTLTWLKQHAEIKCLVQNSNNNNCIILTQIKTVAQSSEDLGKNLRRTEDAKEKFQCSSHHDTKDLCSFFGAQLLGASFIPFKVHVLVFSRFSLRK